MARTNSLNILNESAGKELLAEVYGKVIENVQKNTISSLIKNMDLSGDPAAGSVEAKRFQNAVPQAYGTARTNGAGNALVAKPVTINIDTDKEIVEELEDKDAALYGVDGLLARRANNHALRMIADLDTAFFAKADADGTAFTTTQTAIEDILEAAIQQLETTSNKYVDGVPRDIMSITATPAIYGQIRTYLDKVTVPNVNSADEEFYMYHGVKVFSSVHLPSGTNFILMADGSVAQPVRSTEYTPEKVPLANALALELFYSYGTKSVTPDLILKY